MPQFRELTKVSIIGYDSNVAMEKLIHQRYKDRHKLKQRVLIALYLTFLLATVGEFFYAFESVEEKKEKKVEVGVEIKLPPHIPEEGKVEFIRQVKTKNYRLVGPLSRSYTGQAGRGGSGELGVIGESGFQNFVHIFGKNKF